MQLIHELLDLSCIANATLRLELRALEPSTLIRAAVQAWLPRAEKKSLRLEAKLDESVPPLIADPQRLTQIVTHLVSNAIKFTPPGGHVEVHLERAGVAARIRVIDSGVGIHPEVLAKLFECFRTADGSSKRAHGGLGVGLALVRNLVELHGGKVRAESPGDRQGATFTVELPLAEVAASAPPAVERRRNPEHWRREQPPQRAPRLDGRLLAGIRVLLVDDDKDICEILQLVLESEGAVVNTAASAAEALMALEASMPNVLLSDIEMPGGTGHELMRQVVARKGSDALPAAALSAYGRGQDLRDARAAGFRRLLTKPIDPAALIAAVRDLAVQKAASRRPPVSLDLESRQP